MRYVRNIVKLISGHASGGGVMSGNGRFRTFDACPPPRAELTQASRSGFGQGYGAGWAPTGIWCRSGPVCSGSVFGEPYGGALAPGGRRVAPQKSPSEPRNG